MNLRLNSGNFYLVFGYKKFQTTNTSVVVWFWMNSMLVLEVVWNGEVYEESWYQKGQKSAFLGKIARWYRYLHRVVLVPLNRTHLVPVPRQVVPVPTYRMCLVPVPTYRMCLVPVPNIVVLVSQLPTAQIFVISA